MDSPELHTWSECQEMAAQYALEAGISPPAGEGEMAHPPAELAGESRYTPVYREESNNLVAGSRYALPPNPPKNWDIRKNNINPDHGFGFSLEPRELLYGLPGGVRVHDIYRKDGKVIMAGSGMVRGKSLLKPVFLDYHYLQRTEKPIYGGDGFVRLPAAEFKAGFQFDIVKADRFHYELTVDREEFINGLNQAAEAEGVNLSDDAGDVPQRNGETDPEAMDQYLDEYQEWINGYIDEKFNGLFAFLVALFAEQIEELMPGDYVTLEKEMEGETIYKFDLPLSVSVGTWDYDDGGEFFKGRLGVIEAIRFGVRTSGTFIVGNNIPFKPYVGLGFFLYASLLSFYYWDYKYPGSFDLGMRGGQDFYLNFNGELDDFGATSGGTYLRTRF